MIGTKAQRAGNRGAIEYAGKHRLRAVLGGRLYEWNATATPPWRKRAVNRRRNRVARLSRRINRRTR